MRIALAGLFPPAVEMPRRHDRRIDPPVVEIEERLIVDQDVPASGAVLQFLDVLEQRPVGGEELVVGTPLALHQRMPDEQLPGEFGVDPAVGHLAACDQRDAEQRDPLVRHDGAAILLPVWFAVRTNDEMPGEAFRPFRLDPGDDPGVQPRGLDEFGGHHEPRWLSKQRRSREDRRTWRRAHQGNRALSASRSPTCDSNPASSDWCTSVRVRVRRSASHWLLSGSTGANAGAFCGCMPEPLGDRPQLAVHVLPLPHPQVMQVFGLAHPAELRRRQLPLLMPQVSPQVQQSQEVRGRVGESPVPGVGGVLGVGRSLPRILDGQAGRDDQHFTETAVVVGRHHHPRQPRVEGERGEPAADRCEPPLFVVGAGFERTQLVQQRDAVTDVAPVGWLDERKRRDVPEAEGGHLQDDRRQVGAQDLRLGEFGSGGEILLRIQADADAGRHPSAAPGALICGRLRNRFDRQSLHLEPGAVPGDARGPGVDDVANARDRQRRFRDVRRQHDPTSAGGCEDPVLLGGR